VKKLFTILILVVLLLFSISKITKAAPDNNPIFPSVSEVNQMISESINSLQVNVDNLISRVTATEQSITDLQNNTYDPGYEWLQTTSNLITSDTSFEAQLILQCPEGKTVLSGGVKTSWPMTLIIWNAPTTVGESGYPNAWVGRTRNSPADGNNYYLTVYALCGFPN